MKKKHSQSRKKLSPLLWNWPIKLHSSKESSNCHCSEVAERQRCSQFCRNTRLRKPARLNSSSGAIAGHGQGASLCANNSSSGNQTVDAMCCMAWYMLTSCLASSIVTGILSESFLKVSSDSICETLVCRSTNKTLHIKLREKLKVCSDCKYIVMIYYRMQCLT